MKQLFDLSQKAQTILRRALRLYVGPAPKSKSGETDRGKTHASIRVGASMMLASFLTALLSMFIVFRLHLVQSIVLTVVMIGIEFACNYWQDYSGGSKS